RGAVLRWIAADPPDVVCERQGNAPPQSDVVGAGLAERVHAQREGDRPHPRFEAVAPANPESRAVLGEPRLEVFDGSCAEALVAADEPGGEQERRVLKTVQLPDPL